MGDLPDTGVSRGAVWSSLGIDHPGAMSHFRLMFVQNSNPRTTSLSYDGTFNNQVNWISKATAPVSKQVGRTVYWVTSFLHLGGHEMPSSRK